MICEDKDPDFWIGIASHPALKHTLGGFAPETIALMPDRAIALRSENGGFIFLPADSFGRAYELHTLFTPEGWGREAFFAAREAFDLIFARADLVITHQTDHPQSRPPKTFRFARLGERHATAFGAVTLWMLTREAWLSSPARSH